MAAFASGSTYSEPRLRYLLSMWCARRHRPFAIVADPELIEIFTMLHARTNVPHPITVARDVREIFRLCKQNVVSMLKVSSR
jgi:hypothetical protein